MLSFLLSLLAAAAALLPPSKVVRQDTTATTVTLDCCTLTPAASNTTAGLYKYQNIRFAAVSTGDLRFAAPKWPPVETEINDGSLADVDCASAEDCLYMDIYVPANAANKSLPVLVWTYGGGFTGGRKSENTPEGLFDLSSDFIFVSYNYRLGITGLANGPTSDPAAPGRYDRTSNTGLWDITAIGFSAGGSQVLFEMTRFAGHAEQLFKQAYVTSPGIVPGAGHEHAETFFLNVSSAVGCDGGDLTCLRAVNFTTLQDAADTLVDEYTFQLQPRVDGDFVVDTYEAQFYQNRFNFTGPAVITHEQHEANGQAWAGTNTTKDVSTYLRIFFPAITDAQVEEAYTLYREDDYESPGLRFSDMKQHFDLTAHNMAFTHAMDDQIWNGMVQIDQSTHGTDQSYYWYSTWTLSSDSTSTTTNTSSSTRTGGFGDSSPVDTATAIKMQKYLMSFVLTGNPNTQWPDDKLEWPLYSESGYDLVFNTSGFYTQTSDLENAKVAFWNKALWY
ncbi:hypothetical protein diail_11686 [Diaporthe ilicicola]|nr:hypothetical protein diail_11686 [Diaporthe ilicicola]